MANAKSIAWDRFFDCIYCIHYIPDTRKLPRLISELKRTGIYDSGILNMRYTCPSKWDEIIFNYERDHENNIIPSKSFVNICLEVRKCLAESIAFGNRRILLLENDVAFLKDIHELNSLLELTPKGYGIVQYDKFVNNGYEQDYRNRLEHNRINDSYFTGTGGFFTSAACIGLFDSGITEMKRLMDYNIWPTDIAPQAMNCGYAVSIKNLAIQVFFNGSFSVDEHGIDFMHTVYKNCGVDYSEYAVPKGYGYGKVFSP